MAKKPWWERWPHLYNAQIQALKDADIKYKIKEKSRKKGTLVIHLTYPYEGKDLELEAIFPDFFPFFRFEVSGKNITLPRHQSPVEGNLCFIGRSTENWEIDDKLAKYITDRLPNVIRAGTSATPLPKIEETQAEPISVFYPYLRDHIVFLDSSKTINPNVKKGTMLIGTMRNHLHAILEVRDDADDLLVKTDERLARFFKTEFKIRWVRLPSAIREMSPSSFRKELIKLHPHLSEPEYSDTDVIFRNRPGEIRQMEITGVLFPEESSNGKGEWVNKDGCIFLLNLNTMINKKGWRPQNRRKVRFMRAGRAGQEGMLARIPELQGLRGKKIAVFGLGCLGGSSAIEFGRCGVGELRILDDDTIDPGTTVRWPLGMPVVGMKKTDALKSFIEQSYPYTEVIPEDMRLGATGDKQNERFEKFIDGVDLIYDATAEIGVQHFLSYEALNRKIPYICIATTPGAWGGMIARQIPGKQGCWTCLKRWQNDGDIPVPNLDESNGEVQPQGCASPTFTGAFFDGGQIALSGVRLAVSTLLEG
ncbi:MAG: ThiF family adenylyltransferase, partial [Thermodesulfobacteriota bacterium]